MAPQGYGMQQAWQPQSNVGNAQPFPPEVQGAKVQQAIPPVLKASVLPTAQQYDVPMTVIDNMDAYAGDQPRDKVQSVAASHPVVIVSKSHCPFCIEMKRTFRELGVETHILETDQMPGGDKLLAGAKELSKHKTVPMAFIKGEFVGGCDAVKALQSKGLLQDKIHDLVRRTQVTGAEQLETIREIPPPRGKAVNPLFWFPNTVNNWVVRLTGLQVTILCALSIVYREERAGWWIAAFLLIDFFTRLVVGSSLSLLGMLATVLTAPIKPDFKPGAPKQFAAACGTMFSLIGSCCFFTEHYIPGACVMGGLLGAAGLEAFLDFCLGCVFYGLGIRFKLIPAYVYRIYANSRQETVEAWEYEHLPSNAPVPEKVDTDPSSEIALKYKKRTDEWTKDDFSPVKNMQVAYFTMPLSLAGLAVAFKISSGIVTVDLNRAALRANTAWYHAIGLVAAVVFCIFFLLYALRLIAFPRKCVKEWHDPLRGPTFGGITLTLMLFSFLLFDIDAEGKGDDSSSLLFDGDNKTDSEAYEGFARALFWVGALPHMLMTIAKFGEWVGKRMELEHVHTTWMILPVGCLVAAMVAPVVPALSDEKASENLGLVHAAALNGDLGVVFDSRAFANLEIARFFFSFGFVMWVVLFAITFFKTATTHNSDDRVRHGTFIWVAAPALIAIVEFMTCTARNMLFADGANTGECAAALSSYFFLAIVIFLGLAWATLPYINFFGRDQFSMYYWVECFAADTLAAAAATYYNVFGTRTGECLLVIFLVIAVIFNGVAFAHTLSKLVRRRTVFCPEYKWGPLSFMKLTHEAVRGHLPLLQKRLACLDAGDVNSMQMFGMEYAKFVMIHEEHSRHEDEVIFKAFNDLFPEQGKRFNDDHAHDRVLLARWRELLNTLLHPSAPLQSKQAAVAELQGALPPFIEHFLEHLLGEEDHLNPVGKRYIPLELQKRIARKAFEITSAERWEVLIPYLINNLPRHGQRVRYLKTLCWSMPERAQQLGAIIYRNCDAVKWEQLRVELPEIIPRGASNWRRYY